MYLYKGHAHAVPAWGRAGQVPCTRDIPLLALLYTWCHVIPVHQLQYVCSNSTVLSFAVSFFPGRTGGGG